MESKAITTFERGERITFQHYGETRRGRVIRQRGAIVWVEDDAAHGLLRERWLHAESVQRETAN